MCGEADINKALQLISDKKWMKSMGGIFFFFQWNEYENWKRLERISTEGKKKKQINQPGQLKIKKLERSWDLDYQEELTQIMKLTLLGRA